jgi:alpha-N-arabinofuranosidase
MSTKSAMVHLDPRRTVAPIDRRIFGGFLEHLGRAVYGGIYDPDSPHADARGFRADVADALRALRMPVVRYPGGNFVSNYDWRDGIGPRDQRPTRADFAWKSIETNAFGTDEFVEWCRLVGAAPMLAVNLGTGTPKQAAELVEYCSHTQTSLAALRSSPEPHDVKIWCLGNEMDGPWQAGHVPAEVYAERALTAARLMRGVDPSIDLVACGSSGRMMPTYMEWDRVVLEHCGDAIDFISAHRYSRKSRGDTESFLAEGVVIDQVIDDYRNLIGYVRACRRSDKAIHVSFDEWNVWYREVSGDGEWRSAPPLLEELYTFEDALICAQYLNSFVRNADVVKVACIAQIVNVIAPVLARPNGIVKQTIYWPFAMLSEATREVALRPVVECPTYSCARGDVPMLDVSASMDEEGVTVCLVNRSTTDELAVSIEGRTPRSIRLLAAPLDASNSFDAPHAVVPRDVEDAVLPAHSMAVLEL